MAMLVRGPGRSVSTTVWVNDPVAVAPEASVAVSSVTTPNLSSVRVRALRVTFPEFFTANW